MLPSKFRLSKRDLQVFFRGKSLKVQGNILYLRLKKNHLGYSRWAFVVSSKVKKAAVQRNLARRRMSEIARVLIGSLQPWEDTDFVFFLQLQQKASPSFSRLKNDMIYTLSLCGALS